MVDKAWWITSVLEGVIDDKMISARTQSKWLKFSKCKKQLFHLFSYVRKTKKPG